jgi:hypothetical protein
MVTVEFTMEMDWGIVISVPAFTYATQTAAHWVVSWGIDSNDTSAIFRADIIFFVRETSSSGFLV